MKNIRPHVGILILTIGALLQAHAQDTLTNGLVAYYPFNGNAQDAVGNNHGTTNDVILTTDRFGNPDSAYQFSGYADISFTNAPTLNPTGSFTYAFWMVSTLTSNYPPRPGGYIDRWFLDRTVETSPLVSFALMTDPYGKFWFAIRYDDNTTPPSSLIAGDLTPQVWQHIAMVRDYGNSFRLYVNGLLVGTVVDNGKTLTPPPLKLGMHAWSPDMGFFGKMDNIRIYSLAFSDSEVQQLYLYEVGPRVALLKAVKPSLSGLSPGANYQLQLSGDLSVWTNYGSPFTATNTSMVYPQYWDVDDWGQLFFRLQLSP